MPAVFGTTLIKLAFYRITRGLVLTRPSVDRKKAHLCTTNTFISILFLREESSPQRYLDSYLQDNSGDMQYSASNPVRAEFHFPHFIMVIMCCGPSCGLWFVVVCWCAKQRVRQKKTKKSITQEYYHYQFRSNYLRQSRISVVSDSLGRVLYGSTKLYMWAISYCHF